MARPKAAKAPAALAENQEESTAKAAKAPAAVPAGFLPVEYIGKRTPHADGLYGTYIQWPAQGAVQLVPEAIAARMIAINRDVYRTGVYCGEAIQAAKVESQPDDNVRLELDMVIQTMDKDALESYARTHFRQELDKRRSLDALRQEVGLMIDQFGAP